MSCKCPLYYASLGTTTCWQAIHACVMASLQEAGTLNLIMSKLSAVTGGSAISTAAVTSSPFVVQYSSTDALGNTGALVYRYVSVYDQCAPQQYCTSSGKMLPNDGYCLWKAYSICTASSALQARITVPHSLHIVVGSCKEGMPCP